MRYILNVYTIPFQATLFTYVVIYFFVFHNFYQKTEKERINEMKQMVWRYADHAIPFSTIAWLIMIML